MGREDRAAPGSPQPPWSLSLASGAQPVHGGPALAQHTLAPGTQGTQIPAGVVLGPWSRAQPGGSSHPCQEGLVLAEPPGETRGSASSLPDPRLPQNLLGDVLKARPLVWGVHFGPLWVTSQACLQAPPTPHCLPGVLVRQQVMRRSGSGCSQWMLWALLGPRLPSCARSPQGWVGAFWADVACSCPGNGPRSRGPQRSVGCWGPPRGIQEQMGPVVSTVGWAAPSERSRQEAAAWRAARDGGGGCLWSVWNLGRQSGGPGNQSPSAAQD